MVFCGSRRWVEGFMVVVAECSYDFVNKLILCCLLSWNVCRHVEGVFFIRYLQNALISLINSLINSLMICLMICLMDFGVNALMNLRACFLMDPLSLYVQIHLR